MKRIITLTALAVSLGFFSIHANQIFKFTELSASTFKKEEVELLPGDIIFQSSQSRQCKAVQLATNSPYSHVGMLVDVNGELKVLEAVQPVRISDFNEWISRGKNGHYVVKRLKNRSEVLSNSVLEQMNKIAQGYLGKNYDLYFEWSDERIYCSELVWKLYDETTGLHIGELSTLSSFDLDHPIVQQIMLERYGNEIPYNEKVISPAAMFHSDVLETVVSVP